MMMLSTTTVYSLIQSPKLTMMMLMSLFHLRQIFLENNEFPRVTDPPSHNNSLPRVPSPDAPINIRPSHFIPPPAPRTYSDLTTNPGIRRRQAKKKALSRVSFPVDPTETLSLIHI